MDRQHIETVVRRWTEAIVTGRLDIFKELLAEDVVDRSGSKPVSGVEPIAARAGAVRAAFADIQIAVDELIDGGEAIAWRWTMTGTHVGPFAGLAPTNRQATLRGVNFQRLRGGRIVEHWTLVDVFGAVQGLRC